MPHPSTSPYRTTVRKGFKAAVGDLRARFKIDGDQLGAMFAERLYRDVTDLLALR